ncbi:MAG: S-layer homology domain-containing protein, partial [Clostridia bacterium]|nr:S-layer homology domain-containing protein [Clostridia bacterium]
CGAVNVDSYVDALGHDYEATVTEPTCTEAGYTSLTCSRCGDAIIDEDSYVDALGHDYEATVTEPTCTEQGFTTYTCSRCGDTYVDEESYVDALGHDYEATVTEPTCTEQGFTTYTCSRCGDTYVDEESYVDALGHDYRDIVTLPSCKEQGSTTHVCSRCGHSYTDSYVTAYGHDWDEGYVTEPATTASEGTIVFTCRRCGDKKTERIPPIEEPFDITKVFRDVKAGKWYTKAIEYVYVNGLMKGMTDDTFEPDTTMSRAMVVTVLFRMDGEHTVDSMAPFTDLKANWYRYAVNWAHAKGVVKGVSDTLFDPNGNVTREQLAAILYRYTEYKKGDVSGRADLSSFPDASKVSKYARDAMSWAVAEGLITGNKIGGKDLLDPKGNATRAQVATILMRYLTKEA